MKEETSHIKTDTGGQPTLRIREDFHYLKPTLWTSM